MKIFAVYFRINLTNKPDWFNDFRKKYDDPYDLHLTLIQPRHIEEVKIDELKKKVSDFVDKHRLANEDKIINFNKLLFDSKPEDKFTLMLESREAKKIVDFQKDLREDFKEFGEYTKEVTEQYEVNFKPHITFGRNVHRNIFEETNSYFQAGNTINGIIGELVLTIVLNDSIEEAMNSENLTIFNAFSKNI